MAFTAADLLVIKNDLENDPAGLGLVAPPAIDDVGNADLLNEVLDTIQIDRESISTQEIFLQIDRDEYAALSAADREWLNGISSSGSINPKAGGEVREGILQIFGGGSESRTNLQAILTEPASRITELFKLGSLSQGGAVTPSDVANARNAT